DKPEAPNYFAEMKKVNKEGPEIVEPKEITVNSKSKELNELLEKEDRRVIDTRPATKAQTSLIKGSINITYNAQLKEWAGWLIKYNEKLLLLTEEEERQAVETTLQSIGFDDIEAFIDESVLNNLELDRYETILRDQFIEEMEDDDVAIVDIRNICEWK